MAEDKFCIYCGAKLDAGSQFCTQCGHEIDPDYRPKQPQQQQAEPQLDKRPHQQPDQQVTSKKKIGIIAAVCAVVLIVVVVLVLAFGGNDDSSDVDKNSVANSSAANTEQQNEADESSEGAGNAASSESSSPSSSSSEQGGASSSSSSSDGSSSAKSSASQTGSGSAPVFSGFDSVTASSTLATEGVNTNSYDASNLMDGDTSSCWAEGASGNGVGETVTFVSNKKQTFESVTIWGGYQSSDYHYGINARPKTIAIYADSTLVDTFKLKDAGLGSQTIMFAEPFEASSVTIEIKDIYAGSKYKDCCISEVEFS